MKKKLFLLSTIISSCIFSMVCNQATAADQRHPDMPSGPRKCYPGSKCTGDPNLIYKGNKGQPGMENNMLPRRNTPPQALTMDSVEKYQGVVKNVKRVRLPNETQIQLILQTDAGDITVIVGPARYVDFSKVKFQTGDKILVRGYRIHANGDVMVVASEIEKNGNVLQLLDEKRQPMWQSNNNRNNRR